MNREEFITKLQHALAGGMSAGQVAEHVRYYREYIDSEIRRGKTEAEVLAQLGDPRLLARSIVDAGKRAGTAYGSDYEYDEEVAGEVRDDGRGRTGGVQRVMLPGWPVMLIIVVIAVVVIGLVSSLLYIFAPVIIAVLIVTLVVRLIRDKK